MLFVLLTRVAGEFIYGMVKETDYGAWKEKGGPIGVTYPKQARAEPVIDEQSRRVTNVRFMLTPFHPHPTKQETVTMVPDSIEIIGEIDYDSEGNSFCVEAQDIYAAYQEQIKQLKAEQGKIALPTSDDIASINRQRG